MIIDGQSSCDENIETSNKRTYTQNTVHVYKSTKQETTESAGGSCSTDI